MRIVIDTNVYISALVFNKKIQELLISILHEHQVIISPFILDELRRKLAIKFKLNQEEIQSIILKLSNVTILMKPQGELPTLSSDPDDNNILLLAEYAEASLIISGDKHLYSLKSYKNIKIRRPSDL